MLSLKNTYNWLITKNQRSFYLSIFRVYLCFHLLKDVFFQWSSLRILYNHESFLRVHKDALLDSLGLYRFQEYYQLFILFYTIVISLYLFGIGKHKVAFVLFLCVDVMQRSSSLILNGGDNLLKFLLLYMIFADSYNYFSLSSIEVGRNDFKKLSNLLSNLSSMSIVIHLSFIYFFSGIHKIHSDVWFNGIALYFILQLERFKGTVFNETIAKNGYIITLAAYCVALWETFFIVLVWSKLSRGLMLSIGIVMHLSIYIFMMIHDFEILYIMCYGFFFSNKEMVRICNSLKRRVRFFMLNRRRINQYV
jgi:hypothetical protein